MLLLNLVGNALHGADGSYKKSFFEAGLPDVLRVLLLRPALQQQHKSAVPLLRAALKVMVNMIARSPEATRKMAMCGADVSADHAKPAGPGLLQLTIACCNISTYEVRGRGLTTPLRPVQPGMTAIDDTKDTLYEVTYPV